VDPRAGMDDVEQRKLFTLQELELRSLGRQPIASRYADWAIPGPCISYTAGK
jgi:hypothetical protein